MHSIDNKNPVGKKTQFCKQQLGCDYVTITDYDLEQIRQRVLDLGTEIASFRNVLFKYQNKIRRTMLDLGDETAS